MRTRTKTETQLLSLIIKYGPLTASELARVSGYSRSWVWKTLQRLSKEKVVNLEKRGGTLIVRPSTTSYKKLLRIGILRASEYPYIIPFAKRLKNHYHEVEIIVYDEAFKLAYDIALGKLHLGFAPAISHLIVHRVSGGLTHIIGGGSKGGAGVIEGKGGSGHITTMASTMELCSDVMRLEPPRVYARTGDAILASVLEGKVRYGVAWEPYLYLARKRGLRVNECNLPFCCLLAGNIGIAGEHERISRLLSQAMDEARRRLRDPLLAESYSNLIGIDRNIVAETMARYEFLAEPPVGELKSLLNAMRSVAFPDWILQEAIL